MIGADEAVPAAEPNAHRQGPLDCRVCQEPFLAEGQRLPRILPCGHSICHTCLSRIAGSTSENAVVMLQCPFDRQVFNLGAVGVEGLCKNYALIEVIERSTSPSPGGADASSHNMPMPALSSRSCTVSNENDPLLSHEVSATTSGISQSRADSMRLLLSESLQQPSALDVGFDLRRELELGVKCDESQEHNAVLFCTVCESCLCISCFTSSHVGRVLSKHRHIPISQKPCERRARHKCLVHVNYAVEFVCLEANCLAAGPLMCLLCRDYGAHKGHEHALLDTESPLFRESVTARVELLRQLRNDVAEFLRKVAHTTTTISGIDGADSGTGLMARQQVLNHFVQQRELLRRQESAGLAIIDAHVCERVNTLHQCHEDLSALTADVSAVVQRTEDFLQQDDMSLMIAHREVSALLDSVEQQRVQFLDLPNRLNLDTHIPVCFTKDNRVHIGPRIEMRVVSLGLDDAGKTTMLMRLKQNELVQTVSTIGFNVETVEYKNLRLTIWDVGGVPKLRPLWKHYYLNTQALIFVVDSTDVERLTEVQGELVKLISEEELKDAALLVFANKQDLSTSMSVDALSDRLALSKLCYGRSWHIQGCSATDGEGLWMGIDWLARQLVSAAALTSS